MSCEKDRPFHTVARDIDLYTRYTRVCKLLDHLSVNHSVILTWSKQQTAATRTTELKCEGETKLISRVHDPLPDSYLLYCV